jgi:hypothetical protein
MLLVGPPMPDRSKVMTQTKRNTLVLQGFGVRLTTPHSIKLIVTKVEQMKKLDRFKDDGESC